MTAMNSSTYVLGVDTGGTFTDFVLWHADTLKIHKCLSTPHAPAQAIFTGIQDLGLDALDESDELFIVHGSTVATNAILEGKGVQTAFITNRGFADMLTIGRQTRRELYNLQPQPMAGPVARDFCLETGGRIGADGRVLEGLNEKDIDSLLVQLDKLRPQAVAINLLFSYIDPRFESELEKKIQQRFPTLFIARSSKVLPEYKEYERGMTTWINAYIGPLVNDYLQNLCDGVEKARISVMQSSGGTIAAHLAGEQAVHMVLSGPAGGLAAAKYIGELTDQAHLLTFDMGGTSTDVASIEGDLCLTSEGRIGPYPVAIPMVDMHTIGAGGGSIASVDVGGLLKVGPQSAGADPGPACYGRGGRQATVTDANLVLGRIREDAFLGGDMPLDRAAAIRVVQALATPLALSVEAAALGIIQIANEHMAQALRVISIARGIDPRDSSLVSFGGAGGLHVCALAEALDMHRAIVPIHAGVLSALGMLVAPRSRQLSKTIGRVLMDCDEQGLADYFSPLRAAGMLALIEEGVSEFDIDVEYSLDLRYQGQAYYLNVPWRTVNLSASDFHTLHKQRYGHALDVDLELVNIRVAVSSASQTPSVTRMNKEVKNTVVEKVTLAGITEAVDLLERDNLVQGECLTGPVLITEAVATTFVAPGWRVGVDKHGNIMLERNPS